MGMEVRSDVPVFWHVSPDRLVTDESIAVLGITTVGEVEVVLMATEIGVLITVGSDHTDRHVESFSVAHAKQICAKPVARTCWFIADAAENWDQLVVRAWATEDGVRTLYQEAPLSLLLHPDDLIRHYLGEPGPLPIGTAIFCGTVPIRGDVRPMARLEIELEDPVRRRSLAHGYDVVPIPVIA